MISVDQLSCYMREGLIGPPADQSTGELTDWLFFFQAEDGIRDPLVTGVQTCALPISSSRAGPNHARRRATAARNRARKVGSVSMRRSKRASAAVSPTGK